MLPVVLLMLARLAVEPLDFDGQAAPTRRWNKAACFIGGRAAGGEMRLLLEARHAAAQIQYMYMYTYLCIYNCRLA